MSHTKQFEIIIGHKCFEVEYETDSRVRNRLLSVKYDGLSIDIYDLIRDNHPAYTQIKHAMNNNSDSFWEGELPAPMRAHNEMLGTVLPTIFKAAR